MMAWFKRTLFRRREKDSVPPNASRNYRDLLFPDEGAEDGSPEWRPFFNPFNFRVHVTGSPALGEAILCGQLAQARELTADALRSMSPDESVTHMLDLSTSVITPKPASHDHLKTGQAQRLRTTLL
jgi:hypothetical protein